MIIHRTVMPIDSSFNRVQTVMIEKANDFVMNFLKNRNPRPSGADFLYKIQ